MMNFLITENCFNPKSVEIVKLINVDSVQYLERIEILRDFYDFEIYTFINKILKEFKNFSQKYLEDNRVSSINIEKENIEVQIKRTKQDTKFIKETVIHYRKGHDIKQEIKKIRDQFLVDIKELIFQIYNLEDTSKLLIEDISKEIGYKEIIEISENIVI